MNSKFSRRNFVKSSLLASAGAGLALRAQAQETAPKAGAVSAEKQEMFPKGKIAGQEFSRLMMGGNLIGGWSHSRELQYVSTLMRRYNSPAKIRETLELGEYHGLTAINTYVMDDNSQIFEHWKNGGKIKWFAQARLDANGGFSQVQKAIDEGAVGIHLTGDTCERLLKGDDFDKVADSIQLIRSHKRIAGVAAHDLNVIVECEKRKIDVDFYQKTFHTHDYFTAPGPDDNGASGSHDNSWCNASEEVAKVFSTINKPFIAFKILAAGGIPPLAAFPYAFNSGADFILVGMFDWQIEADVDLAREVLHVACGPHSKRTRPWCDSVA